ncbi:MAG: 50S ribosomal protein L24 [Candidatus Doudnabacteria bacterium]|nr:50S ribosomal protein L24 [Candidatus Doudnabacteria bacterium]
MQNLRVRKNDNVQILAGKDRGRIGKIVFVDRKSRRVTVEGLNLLTRFQRPKKAGQKGQRVQLPMPLPAAKVMVVCPSCGKLTRVGFVFNTDGKKLRACKKCKANF